MVTNASGIRLLAVDSNARGMGIGRALTQECIQLAKEKDQAKVILHATKAMQKAWGLYERMGFKRSPYLDFEQEGFPVYGFNLEL
jgi:ribosomal protein S18 acetylase RimI-like enzyme